jgi:hypothetical protein
MFTIIKISRCKNCLIPKPAVQQRKKSDFLSRSSEHLNRALSNSSEYLTPIDFSSKQVIAVDDEIIIPRILKNVHYESEFEHHYQHYQQYDADEDTDLNETREVEDLNFIVKGNCNAAQSESGKTEKTVVTNNVIFKSKLNPVPTKMRHSSQSNITNSDLVRNLTS